MAACLVTVTVAMRREFTVFAVGYTMDHIVYKWLPNPVEMESNLELPQFKLVNFTLSDCSQNYTTGEVSMLEARVKLVCKQYAELCMIIFNKKVVIFRRQSVI